MSNTEIHLGQDGVGELQRNQSPGKEDENRGFAWGKGMLSSGLRLPLKWVLLKHDSR